MRASDLTPVERWLYMPKWRKAVLHVFVAAYIILGSFEPIM